MPVTSTIKRTRLQMKMNTGTDDKGNAILRSKTYGNVKVDALDEDIYIVGLALAGLQMHPVDSIQRLNDVELEEAV
jgi:hypothetical protein